jgi:hypothetical protein
MLYKSGIQKGIELGHRSEVISRKIYITYPTFAFEGDYDLEFDLLNSVSTEFKIPISSIQIAGSSKTGYSYVKSKEFVKGTSDLDVAIVDPWLFQKYCEIVMRETAGFKDLSKFERTSELNKYDIYSSSLSKGFFRPDCMPVCEAKKKWFNFFNKLSQKYLSYFENINAGIYFSQVFFEYKQATNIDIIRKGKS